MKFRGPKATKTMIKYSNRIKDIADTTNIKIKYSGREDIINNIIQSLASKNKKNIRKNWDLAFIAVTIDALYHKFNQYKSLKDNIMRIPDNTYILDGTDDNKLGQILTSFIHIMKNGHCSNISKPLKEKIKYSLKDTK